MSTNQIYICLWIILKIGTDVIFFIVLISNLIVRYNVGRSQLQSTPAKSERVTIPIWHPFKVNKNQMVMKSNVFISSIVLKSTITWIGKLIWTSLNCVYELLSTDVSYILQWQYIQVFFCSGFVWNISFCSLDKKKMALILKLGVHCESHTSW